MCLSLDHCSIRGSYSPGSSPNCGTRGSLPPSQTSRTIRGSWHITGSDSLPAHLSGSWSFPLAWSRLAIGRGDIHLSCLSQQQQQESHNICIKLILPTSARARDDASLKNKFVRWSHSGTTHNTRWRDCTHMRPSSSLTYGLVQLKMGQNALCEIDGCCQCVVIPRPLNFYAVSCLYIPCIMLNSFNNALPKWTLFDWFTACNPDRSMMVSISPYLTSQSPSLQANHSLTITVCSLQAQLRTLRETSATPEHRLAAVCLALGTAKECERMSTQIAGQAVTSKLLSAASAWLAASRHDRVQVQRYAERQHAAGWSLAEAVNDLTLKAEDLRAQFADARSKTQSLQGIVHQSSPTHEVCWAGCVPRDSGMSGNIQYSHLKKVYLVRDKLLPLVTAHTWIHIFSAKH